MSRIKDSKSKVPTRIEAGVPFPFRAAFRDLSAFPAQAESRGRCTAQPNYVMMHFIRELLEIRPYRLTIRFNAGEVRVVDLEATLRAKANLPQSAYARLLDPATFLRARLDPESRAVCWDGLAREIAADGTEKPAPPDLCPAVLLQLSAPLAPGAAAALTAEALKLEKTSGYLSRT